MTIKEKLQEKHNYKELLFANGFDKAILGVAWAYDKPLAVAYDKDKCIKILMERDGMNEADASEFFSYNVEGAYVGEQTPVFVELKK